ncbi:MAG: hypothetical protein U7M05_12295 [Candidatus Igneacidithiobacillus chanchocoensis]
MKLPLILLPALLLTACATTTQQTQVQYVQACTAYGAAFNAALALREAGKLTPAQINQVNLLDSQITPICTGPLPADPQAATAQVTAAVTTLAIIEAAQHASKP